MGRYGKANSKKLVQLWAEKEKFNLRRYALEEGVMYEKGLAPVYWR